MYSTLAIIIAAIIFISLVWYRFFVPINKMITGDVEETTSPKRTDLSKLLITLSTASIVFTVGLMNEELSESIYLKYAWFSFFGTIILGVMMFFLEYIRDMSNEIMNKFVTGAEGRWKKEHHQLASNGILLEKIVFLLHFGEVVSLILALNFLMIFGTKNL